jgi:triacylglycerol lipase
MLPLRILNETLRTLHVTTLQPVGWSLGKLHERLRTQSLPQEAIRVEKACPIVLVHGILHNATAFYTIERRLRAKGFNNLESVNLWTTLHSIDAMANDLKTRVNSVWLRHRQQGAPGKVRLVAHSLGGMVVRRALHDADFAKKIDKIIFLGTPHQGNVYYRVPFPRAVKELAPHSAMIKRFKEEPLPPGVQFWNIRGTLDLVTPGHDTFLPHVPNLVFDGVGHAGLLSARRVFQAMLAILETPLYDDALE